MDVASATGDLHLGETAIHEQLGSRDVAAVVGREKHHGLGDLLGCAEPAEGNTLEIIYLRCWPVSEPSSSLSPGVSVEPGLTALTRMRRACKSVVQVHANARTAALVALYTLFVGNPFLATMDAFRMIEAPSGIRGSAFCTVNRRLFTLMVKSVS